MAIGKKIKIDLSLTKDKDDNILIKGNLSFKRKYNQFSGIPESPLKEEEEEIIGELNITVDKDIKIPLNEALEIIKNIRANGLS